MAYIEDRIDILEQDFDTMWSKLCALENAVYEIADGDEPQVQQTMDEFVKVVRCKNCKWWHANVGLCEKHGLLTNDGEDYCSRGIKK